MDIGARLMLALLWLLHFLPLGVVVALGRGFGALLHAVAHERRRIAQRNFELCFPHMSQAERDALVREHFRLLGRSIFDRSVLWYASPQRLKRLIHVEGDVSLAESGRQPVCWLAPHFMGLEVAGMAIALFQGRPGIGIYQRQKSAVFDRAIKRGRTRLGLIEVYPRDVSIRVIMKRVKEGRTLFTLPDQDFGPKDAVFVPFFGVPACTLVAPSRMARVMGMALQPVIVHMLPGGQGWRVTFAEPWPNWPTEDATADAAAMNGFIEDEIARQPAQYLWVHKRFKTTPPGGVNRYAGIGRNP